MTSSEQNCLKDIKCAITRDRESVIPMKVSPSRKCYQKAGNISTTRERSLNMYRDVTEPPDVKR